MFEGEREGGRERGRGREGERGRGGEREREREGKGGREGGRGEYGNFPIQDQGLVAKLNATQKVIYYTCS